TEITVAHDNLVFCGRMLGDGVVDGDAPVARAAVDLAEDIGRALKDHLSRPARQTTHAGAVLARIAAVDAQPALAEEAQRAVFPAFGCDRQSQCAHAKAPRTVFSSSVRLTRVSSRVCMLRTTAVASAR